MMRQLSVVLAVAVLAVACGSGEESPAGGESPEPDTDALRDSSLVIDTVPPEGPSFASSEAFELARQYEGSNEAEGFVRELSDLGNVAFLGELSDIELLAYGFDLLLREPELIDRIMAAEDAEDLAAQLGEADEIDEIAEAIDAYIDEEVARLATLGFTGPGVRGVVVAVRDAYYRLSRLIDASASELDCPEHDQGFLHSDPAPDFAGYATAEEAAGHGPATGWNGEALTGAPVFSGQEGDAQIWHILDADGATIAEVYVSPHGDGWFPSNVTYCSGS